jgi:PAS domain S-box-containing protein
MPWLKYSGLNLYKVLAFILAYFLLPRTRDSVLPPQTNPETVFHSLINSIPGIVFVVDRIGIVIVLAGSSLKALGVEPKQFLGRSIFELYRNHPDILSNYNRALNGETVGSTIELNKWVFDVWLSPLTEKHDKITGVIGVATDVTDRKKAEDILQYQAELLQSVSDAIIATNTTFLIESWNEAAENMYGWRVEEVIDKSLPDLLMAVDADSWKHKVEEHIRIHGYWKGEVTHKGRDGALLSILVSASPLEDAGGEMVGLVFVNRDITEIKRAEQQSLDLAIERERVKLLREFVGDASHDLKTPLTTIQTSIYLMRKKYADLNIPQIDVIETQVHHLADLVENLLTLSRLDAKSGFELQRKNVADFVEKTVVAFQPVAAHRDRVLELDIQAAYCVAQLDDTELRRALSNLLNNAINYTPAAGRIRVRLYTTGEYVAIEVADTGIGISEQDLTRVFDRFYRADKSRRGQTGGTGLGLAITKKIVESHGGKVSVESTLNVGSTFTIWLPADKSSLV